MKGLKLVGNILAIAAFLGTALALQAPKLNQKLGGQTVEADQQAVTKEKARLNLLKQMPSGGLGFNNLIADTTFMSFAQYFGDDVARVQHKTGYGLSPDYFDVIVARDPRFISSYIFLSTSVSNYAAQPSKAIELYAQGLKFLSPEQLPSAYTVWRRKAIDELLFLGDGVAARTSYLKAAEWAERAKFDSDALPETKAVAQQSRESAEFLRGNPSSKSARISAWSSVLGTAVDRKTAQIAITELDKLGIDVKINEQGQIQTVPRKQ